MGIADVLEEEGRRLEAEIAEAGGDAVFIRLDATSEEDWIGAVAEVERRYGKLDVLVNNAGIYRRGYVLGDRLRDLGHGDGRERQGRVPGHQGGIPAMRRAGGGSIVNISSTAGLVGGGAAAYNASRARFGCSPRRPPSSTPGRASG